MKSQEKYYYLNRDKSFSEVELVSQTPWKRVIRFLEGDQKNQEKNVHPELVAWGSMYPRLFKSTEKPNQAFIFKGRVLQQYNQEKKALTPDIDKNYRFQPYVTHIIDAINSKDNVLLTGPTGVGKTTIVEQLASRVNQELLRINFNSETRLSDLLGKVQVVNGETKWVDSVLPIAMKNGYWLLLDEMDVADPSILALLHPVLEENSCLVLKENNGEVIKPHPNFRVFATANSIGAMSDRASTYAGTNHMNEAFLDRWQIQFVPNLTAKEELKVIKNKIGGLKHRWALKMVNFAEQVRNKNIEGIDFASDNFSTRKVIAWAKKTALLRSPVEGAKYSWIDKTPSADHDAIIKVLELNFGSGKRIKKNKAEALDSLGHIKKSKSRKKKTTQLSGVDNTVKRGRGRPKKNILPLAQAVSV